MNTGVPTDSLGNPIQQFVTEGGRVGKEMINQMSAFHDKVLCVAMALVADLNKLAKENDKLRDRIVVLEGDIENLTRQYYAALDRD